MDQEIAFQNTVRAIASTVASVLAALANVFEISPTIISANFIDLIASAVMAVAAVYFFIKRMRTPAEPTV